MAQADKELGNVADGQYGSGAEHTTRSGFGAICMPHIDLTREQLDILHPSLSPPDEEQLDDLADDLRDAVCQKSLTLADGIRSETSLQGRVRRPLLARLQEQQQKNLRREASRASTSRILGGGVAKEALTSTLTAAVPTNSTTTIRTIRTNGTTEDLVGSEGADAEGWAKGDDETESMQVSDRRFVKQIQSSCTVLARARTVPPLRALERY